LLVIVVLIFGVGRLPEVGGAVGKSIREFRKATKDPEDRETTVMTSTDAPAANGATKMDADITATPSAVFCGECGTKNAGTAKFCANCGHAISTPVA
jgi:sec-independent protein translocase protein TatA